MKSLNYDSRKYILAGAVVLVLITYIIRLFNIQILDKDYKNLADSNAFYYKSLYPSRGLIYDRNGKLLVYNQPSYDITYIPREIRGIDTLELCRTLCITLDEFHSRIKRSKNRRLNPGYSAFTEQEFMTQLTNEEYARFQEKLFRFPGFYVRKRSVRQYTTSAAGVLLGDIGQVSQKDIDNDSYYSRGDYIGKQGLEAAYETSLRGEKGTEVLLRDAHGRIQGSYMEGKADTLAIRGKDLTLTLDIALQELGERLMQNKLGSIVAIEPSTGEVLCMVSAPSYDPALLTGRQRGRNHVELSRDRRKPLMNRAIMGKYPPGSTFKTSQALTFLEEGIITPETKFGCSNGFVFNDFKLGCHAHYSPIALKPAIATSCNAYFCWGLHRMFGASKYKGTKNAMNVWRDYMVSMGFGYPLGIDLPGESRGMIPNAEYYTKHHGNYWKAVTVISISIGQGEVALTPLQIANLGATIANRGTYIIPHVVKEIENGEIDSLYRTPKSTMAGKKAYEEVVKGMREAVTSGTCRAANIPGLDVCGKTGTAENTKGQDHSAFMGFAPMNEPKIAVAVYVENGGFGARFGVPIGALIIEQFLNGKLSEESEAAAQRIQETVIDYGTAER